MSSKGGYRTQQFGKYTLLERVGAGGMAEIWRAKVYGQHGFEKEVALKKILPNLTDDAEFVEMFINEAKIMVGLVHGNIVQVFDLGEIGGQYFIGMEYVAGKDLLDLLARCAESHLKVPLKLGIFVVMEMLKGLDYAHSARDYYGQPLGIIHRDVSPSNVLLSYGGEVKVGDFGVAKAATQRSHTEVGTLKGKVGYMSPEQVRGDAIDHRSDLFAAGIILFEILNMRRLFIGGSDLDVMLRVRDVEIEQELKSSIALPHDLRAIVKKALARDVQARYQTARELHDDLMDFLYRNRIRVTPSDLARFLGRVFEKDIEQDKLKRLHFRDEEEALRRAAAVRFGENSGLYSGVVPAPPQPQPQAAPPPSAAPAPAPEPALPEIQYRYRDRAGLVFGPMSARTLTNLLISSPLDDEDRISVGGGVWQPLSEVVAIHGPVLAAKRAASAVAEANAAAATPPPISMLLSAPEPIPVEAPLPPAPQSPVPLRGQLAQHPFAGLLHRIWAARADGCLTVRDGETYKQIYFGQGNPAQVTSNNDAELLGNFLVREGILAQDQLDAALDRARAFGGRLGDALVADRVLQSHVLFEYLFRQAKLKLFDVFSWTGGTFEYDPVATPGQRAYPLGIDSLEIILEGVKRYIPTATLATWFQDRQFIPLNPTPDPAIKIDDLRLPAKQFRIAAAAISPPVNLDTLDRKLTAAAKVTLEEIHRVVYLLIQLQVVTFAC